MMQPDLVTTATVSAGKLTIHSRQQFLVGIAGLREGEYLVKVERRRATRSLVQNAYYFGAVLTLLSEHTGFTVDELHEWAKAKFLPKSLAFADGNGEVVDELVIGGSTTKLNKIQFGEYVEEIRRFAAEHLDVVIPDPDPNYHATEPDETPDGH